MGIGIKAGILKTQVQKTYFQKLDIEPIIQLHNQSSLFGHKSARKIIVRIYQKEIRNRSITPLQPCVDIQVINLIVVLQKSRPKQIFGKCQVNPRAYKK